MLKIIRIILNPLVLLFEKITTPPPPQRDQVQQQKLDGLTSRLVLYQFRACPFCVKVRKVIAELGLKIELRDAQNNPQYRNELQTQGGELQVPCLRIAKPDGSVQWLYESDDINRYLRSLVG